MRTKGEHEEPGHRDKGRYPEVTAERDGEPADGAGLLKPLHRSVGRFVVDILG